MKNRVKDFLINVFPWIIFLCIVIFACSIGFTHFISNKQIIDYTYTFEYGIISLPNGEVVEGKVTSWADYEDGDTIQLKIDGKTYLTHISNVVLISE